MTIRKTNKSTGEVTSENYTILGLLLGTGGFRLVITLLIISMHPIGRGFLSGFGFKFPDEKLIAVAAEKTKDAESELTVISDSIKEMRTDLASLKANNAILNSKVDNMEQTFRGFQVDFNKWKPTTESTN
jgi:phage shock protein A